MKLKRDHYILLDLISQRTTEENTYRESPDFSLWGEAGLNNRHKARTAREMDLDWAFRVDGVNSYDDVYADKAYSRIQYRLKKLMDAGYIYARKCITDYYPVTIKANYYTLTAKGRKALSQASLEDFPQTLSFQPTVSCESISLATLHSLRPNLERAVQEAVENVLAKAAAS